MRLPNKNKWSIKCIVAVLAICMVAAFVPLMPKATYASANDAENTLQESMEYLVNGCGQRLYGSPNEAKAAEYVKDQFESYGYKNVDWAKIPQPKTNYVGRLTFDDGSPDILGNPYPANPTAGNFAEVTGTLVDLGTVDNYDLPEGASGDIIGAVRFTANAPTPVVLNNIIASIKANTGVTLKGMIVSRSGGSLAEQTQVPTFPLGTGTYIPEVPCVLMADMFLEEALENKDNFVSMERYERTETNAVVATKPAPSGDPDLIILVTAHLDCTLASKGASNNASGVAACLELARRYADKDMGNYEIRFAALGANEEEKENEKLGAKYLRDQLSAEQKAISINMNMDMLCSPKKTAPDAKIPLRPLNAVTADIYMAPTPDKPDDSPPLAFNMPAWLITDNAGDVTWAEGIENVRIFKYGSSDHVVFQQAGIDASSMTIVLNDNDDVEFEKNKSLDNLEDNYSYERLLMCTDLMAKGIQKAVDLKLTKKAELICKDMGSYKRISLTNYKHLFKVYDRVTATVKPENNPQEYNISFTEKKPYVNGLPAYDTFTVDVYAHGSGTADNRDTGRNEDFKNFKIKLGDNYVELNDYKVTAKATKGGSVTGSGTYEEGKKVTLKAVPKDKYRFVRFTDADTGKRLSTAWNYSFTARGIVDIVGNFTKIAKPSITVKAVKGKKATVKWKAVTGAYKYQVYRATSKNGKYTRVATVAGNKLSFTNTKLKAGKKYYYKVRVVCKSSKTTYGDFSAVKYIKARK